MEDGLEGEFMLRAVSCVPVCTMTAHFKGSALVAGRSACCFL